MAIQSILLPLFVQVFLTFCVLFLLARRRYRAVKAKEVRGTIKLREDNWPPYVTQVSNNYLNQFEIPVLFYVWVIVVILTRQYDTLFVLLAWVFVATRVLHAAAHVTSNRLRFRGPFFVTGAILLFGMWVALALRILLVSAT